MRRVSLPAAISPSHNFTLTSDPGEAAGRLGRLKPVLKKVSILERPEHDLGDWAPQRKLSVVWARTTPGEAQCDRMTGCQDVKMTV